MLHQRDRKSGSAGMPRPRSTLFPYTTLFRSYLIAAKTSTPWTMINNPVEMVIIVLKSASISDASSERSEERFSRNAETEIYTLSLHDALPILFNCSKDEHSLDHDK